MKSNPAYYKKVLESNKRYRQKHKDKIDKKHREWKRENRSHIREQAKQHYVKKGLGEV